MIKYCSHCLPEGNYNCKVVDVKYEPGDPEHRGYAKVYFDVASGDYKGFFLDNFESQDKASPIWHGFKKFELPQVSSCMTPKDVALKKKVQGFVTKLQATNPDMPITYRMSSWIGASANLEVARQSGSYKGYARTYFRTTV